ncbi:MAG: GNAT family N-acetyltransferase [Flavobacteriales bacterium]|nr:GNAT family N-acetyltransferase [Flavobacteriales bacterium]
MTPPAITWSLKAFDALTPLEMHELFRLRVDVFVVEQKCPYPEIDGQDPLAMHLLGFDPHGSLIAYARILPPKKNELPHIGRVVVAAGNRRSNVGRLLMEEAMNAVSAVYGNRGNAVAAQAYLIPFYSSLGYVTTSEEYIWDGIPHVDMVLTM